MKQYKIINAYNFIDTLSDNDKLSYEVLWSLFQLKKALQPHFDFFTTQLEKIKTQFLPEADENGEIKGEVLHRYSEEINKLGNMDKEINIQKFTVKLKDFPGITLKTMEALEDFIEFEKE